MIPKPPFASDLSLAEEIEGFERLKPRLRELWSAVFPGDDAPYTSVVVPSCSLVQHESAAYDEERLLFLLIRLRNPYARLVYVTSEPIHPLVVEYYLQLLAGIPASHARARLTFLCAHDHSPRPLTQKILERPRLIQRIRAAIPNPARAYLTAFHSTPLERRLAVLLGIPMNGLDPDQSYLGTRAGSRGVFREAGVEHPLGADDLRSPREIEDALLDLRRRRPGLAQALLTLNEGAAGMGEARFRFPQPHTRAAIGRALDQLELSGGGTVPGYLDEFARRGGVVEEYPTAPETAWPSVELRINPHGVARISSTHERSLGGPTGHVFVGSRFPARDDYRTTLHEAGLRIGRVLAAKGVVSRFSVDFLARRAAPGAAWDLSALTIHLGMGHTTHPMLALRFLTGGALDAETGLFRAPSGRAKHYRATDNLRSDAYSGLLPEDLIEIVTVNKLAFDHGTETGVLFHRIGAISQFGEVGLVAIGNSLQEAEELYARTVEILDAETRYGRAAAAEADTPARIVSRRAAIDRAAPFSWSSRGRK